MARKKLNDTHRAFLVEKLACFMSPKEAAEALSLEHGVTVAPQSAERYDPYKKAGSRIAPKWKFLFDHTRKAFLDHIENHVPHAHKAVRVKKLAEAADAYQEAGNYMAMANMLERIAKEMGNVHTNRREITGKDRGPVQFSEVDNMTMEQVKAELQRYGIDPTTLQALKTEH